MRFLKRELILINLILILFLTGNIINAQFESDDRFDEDCVIGVTQLGYVNLVNEVCQSESEHDIDFVPQQTCEDNGIPIPDIDRYRCVRHVAPAVRGAPPVITYDVVEYVLEDADKGECQWDFDEDFNQVGTQDPDKCEIGDDSTRCIVSTVKLRLLDTVDPGNSEINYPGQDLYRCVPKCAVYGNSINVFNYCIGPIDQAIAKIVRTALTAILILAVVFMSFRLIYVFWQISQRNQESFENSQKTLWDSILGILILVFGIVVIQVLSSLFGISGNIFDFSYNPF